MRLEQEQCSLNGGIMTVQPVSAGQIIYLDFDGEFTCYNGDLLTIDNVTIEDSGLTEERIAAITAMLNQQFRDWNVEFVTEKPALGDYSTIYIGKTSSFAPYGSFAGLAETVDSGNKIHNDNAFVMLDSLSSNNHIAGVIAHEAGHLLGTLDHGGEGMARYAQNYDVSSGVTSTGCNLYIGDVMTVCSGGTVNHTTVYSGGSLRLSNGGTANSTVINYVGSFVLTRNGIANNTVVNSGGTMSLYHGGTADGTVINSGGVMNALSGVVNNTTINSGGFAGFHHTGTVNNTIINFSASMIVYYTAVANSTTVRFGGRMQVKYEGAAYSTEINSKGLMSIYSGGTANSTTVNSGGTLHISRTGVCADTVLHSEGKMFISSGGSVSGSLQIETGAVVSAYSGAVIDFTVAEQTSPATALINNWSLISGGANARYTITVKTDQASGTYVLAGKAAEFNKAVSVKTTLYEVLGTVSLTQSLSTEDANYTLSKNGDLLVLTVSAHGTSPTELSGNEKGLSWKADTSCKVMYSPENSTDGIQFVTSGNAVDTYGVPAGKYDWKVAPEDSSEWVKGNTFTASGHASSTKLESDNDGNGDIFFADGSDVWKSGYAAEHVGCGTWSGTGEQVDLAGKNKITDVFEGSTDANILVMTDDANGDALFADDIYSAFPDEQQARLAQIDEIRAGDGDDIVDMTSQQFAYSGDGLGIRGGNGNDVIWANSGDNKLFGDAGDDRIAGASGNDVIVGGSGNDSMHGGGGNDIFCFCKGWGTDTVEQLNGGSVTLWFISGNMDNWDQDTMTYLAGKNSVHVLGVTQVTLKFGDDGSALYDTLLADGAFMEVSSEKIYEESGKGVLAKL